jgi:hypothetical protein
MLQELYPVVDVLSMPQLAFDFEVSTQEGRGRFCHELFSRVCLFVEAIPEVAVEACLVTCPVSLMPRSA